MLLDSVRCDATREGRSQARWWSWTGSNRRPPACKAGALPTELQPLSLRHSSLPGPSCTCFSYTQSPPASIGSRPSAMSVVGLDGFEPSTPALSRRCSNQLSYRPLSGNRGWTGGRGRVAAGGRCRQVAESAFEPSSPDPFPVTLQQPISVSTGTPGLSEKGGDPAAPSDTATLLRLHPSHETHRGNRPPCG